MSSEVFRLKKRVELLTIIGMKKRGIFLVICLLLYPAWGIYAEAFSQSKVSLKMQNVTLDRVFQTLGKQC